MPAANLQAYKVANLELLSDTKQDNMVQAIEDYLNSIDNAKVATLAAIAVSKLAAGSNGQVLRTLGGVPSWDTGYATTLPGSPVDGQQTILVDSTTAPTYQWLLRYNSTTAKWHYLGGLPASVLVDTNEATTSATYVALTTAGPSFALPVAGDYDIEIEAMFTTVTAAHQAFVSYDIGGTGALDADGSTFTGGINYQTTIGRRQRKTGLTAVTLTAKYRSDGANSTQFQHRLMRVTPVKIG